MDEPTIWLIIAGLALLAFIYFGFVFIFAGAVLMFSWAYAEAGFFGTMIMLAFWIFALPVMVVLAAIIGIVAVACGDG